MDEELINRRVARRRLLSKAGAIAAAAAGAGAVSAAIASPAEATVGQPLVVGTANDGGTVTTALDNLSVDNATLALANDGAVTVSGLSQAGAPLTLVPNGDYVLGPVGSLGVSEDGTLWSTGYDPTLGGTGAFPDFVRTGSNSTIVQSFAPVRILDTRPDSGAVGKASMLNASILTPQGFVPAGGILNISLDSLLVWGWAVFVNIAVIAGGQAGFITAFPTGKPLPNAANLNYVAGQILSNAAFVSVGEATGALNAISLRAHTPAQLIVDVAGAVVNYPSDVKLGGGGGGFSPASADRGPAPRIRPANTIPLKG